MEIWKIVNGQTKTGFATAANKIAVAFNRMFAQVFQDHQGLVWRGFTPPIPIVTARLQGQCKSYIKHAVGFGFPSTVHLVQRNLLAAFLFSFTNLDAKMGGHLII